MSNTATTSKMLQVVKFIPPGRKQPSAPISLQSSHFTLNRVYTEWYRNKGKDFTITSSTAYDHKFVPGRNIFESISAIVDEIFSEYLSRPNVEQPILTQYCDGKNVSCPNWLSQWGSKALGDQGYTAIEILRNYYGDSIYINSTDEISGIPSLTRLAAPCGRFR